MGKKKISRRDFLKETAAAGAMLPLAGLSALAWTAPAAGDRPPNLLIFFSDQERPWINLPPLSRPNRERLRPNAVEFTQYFCTQPLCSPSRATMLTGLYPHQAGVETNVDFGAHGLSLDPKIPGLGTVFKAAGYETGYVGKWHLSRGVRPRLKEYGFDFWRISNQVIGTGSDDDMARIAARWIRSRKKDRPWLLMVSILNPHDICFPALFRHPSPREVSLPPNFHDDLSKKPAIQSEFIHHDKAIEKAQPHTEEQWLHYLRVYCDLNERVDRHLGVVLDGLERSGQRENTAVIYTSDHGEMGGSHGLIHKGPFMYEENLRIPFLLSRPNRLSRAATCPALASNLDLAPTLSALSGVKWPKELPGMSLVEYLKNPTAASRDKIFSEWGVVRGTPRIRAVRTQEWKYSLVSTGEEELYHLAEDPGELNNRASDPGAAAVKQELAQAVQHWREETQDPTL